MRSPNRKNLNYRKGSFSLVLIFFILVCPIFLAAQDLMKVKGNAQVRIGNNLTKDLARQMAEELAMIDALNNSFGTYVEQTSNIALENGKINYDIIGKTQVQGEWIRTTNIYFTEDIQVVVGDHGKENMVWLKCEISGEARKITSKAKLIALPLICPDINCTSEEFINEQNLYLYFNSPIAGFLSVFIEEGDVTRRLFPYDSQGDKSAVSVNADTEYLLFCDNKRMDEFNVKVDKIMLYTEKPLEYNTLHVVFSTEPYIKPLLTASVTGSDGYVIPRSISTAEFKAWMSDCRVSSSDFQSLKIRIRIRKKS